jgi:hypothetical protein
VNCSAASHPKNNGAARVGLPRLRHCFQAGSILQEQVEGRVAMLAGLEFDDGQFAFLFDLERLSILASETGLESEPVAVIEAEQGPKIADISVGGIAGAVLWQIPSGDKAGIKLPRAGRSRA